MVIKTQNSTYELDVENKKIRRLYGACVPTNRQGNDGDWKYYYSISEIVINKPLIIVWNIENGLLKTTVTSKIKSTNNDKNLQ